MDTPTPGNFIKDLNRFNLEIPPTWWLQGLKDYDDQLVVVPSRTDPVYRLCRRTRNTIGLESVAIVDRHADTAMMYEMGLVPVTSILVKGLAWDLVNIIESLRSRDIWANGGPDAVADALDAQDELERVVRRRAFKDDIGQRAKDAYRSMMARIGARSKRASDFHGAARPLTAIAESAVPTPPSSIGTAATPTVTSGD